MRGGGPSTRVLCGCPSLFAFRYPEPADVVGRTIAQRTLFGSRPLGQEVIGESGVPREILEQIVLGICDGELTRGEDVVGKMLSNGGEVDEFLDAQGRKRSRGSDSGK